MRLADLRTDYRDGSLDLGDLDPDPLRQFAAWLAAATTAGLPEPNAMCLATVDADGAPSSRMVLLKGLEEGRLLFFTDLTSRKARALAHEPRCALTFWWAALERQVRVEGRVERLSDVEADAYFAGRPRGSQLATWASQQSRAHADRAALTSAYSAADARFPESVPRPPTWGGYAVLPLALEFWQGRASRLHDRFRYERMDDGWTRSRLGP